MLQLIAIGSVIMWNTNNPKKVGKFFVANDLNVFEKAEVKNLGNSEAKIKNQIRSAMEVRI